MQLAATVVEPGPGATAGVTVVVCSAMVVRREFYAGFARHLAGLGMRVLTFDNRGVGATRAAPRSDAVARLAHWGERDVAAAIEWAARTAPGDRLLLVGHSMGGRIAALCPSLPRVEAVVAVVPTTPWWRYWPPPYAAGIRLFYAAAGALCRRVPVLPAHWLDMGPPVRSSVILDWVAWGIEGAGVPGQASAVPPGASYPGRVLALSFTDDVGLGCHRAVREACGAYAAGERLEHWHLAPRELGVSRVGHFGYFRGCAAPELWRRTLEWFERSAPREPGAGPRAS